ncbi:MAG: BrnT family toxin, partial [Alphaproteobacteria bacterium]
MISDEFEWDDAKAAANAAKHGVPFELAKAIFGDPFAIELMDDRHDYGEERWTILGMAGNRLLFVAYTMRGERIRI